MKLYHGTSERVAMMALQTGIKPPIMTRSNNWRHTMPSHRKAVYMTDTYPIYFALNATPENGSGRLAVIEIDTDKLDLWRLCPDEDALEQAMRGRDDLPEHYSLRQRTAHYRKELDKRCDGLDWLNSIEALGSCAHLGVIRPDAITRMALIDQSEAAPLLMDASQASITMMNYRVVGHRYRCLLADVFGEPHPEPRNDIQRALGPTVVWPGQRGITVLQNTPAPAKEMAGA